MTEPYAGMQVHGTADDNVHLAHSMHISRALIDQGIMFKQMVGGPGMLHITVVWGISDIFGEQSRPGATAHLRSRVLLTCVLIN